MVKRIVYSKEECRRESEKYGSRSEFSKKNWCVFRQCRNNGWLDEFYPLFRRLTYEQCYEIAKGYTEYRDFREKETSAYSKAISKGWVKDYVWLRHYRRDANAKINCVYAYEFPFQRSVYVGRTLNKSIRYWKHLHEKNDSVYIFMKDNNLYEGDFDYKILADGLALEESADVECEYIEKYASEGWKLINRTKGGSIGSPILKWTYDKCMEKAKQYVYVKDFRDEWPQAYQRSVAKGWNKEYTWLMRFKPKNTYTYDECLEKAKLCKSWTQFVLNYPSYKSFSVRMGWIKDWEWLKVKKKRDIVEYDLKGDFIAVHRGSLTAKFGKDLGNILLCAKGEHKYHRNRIWRYEDEVLGTDGNIMKHIEVNINPSYFRPVVQYDLEGNYIREYESIKSTGYCSSSIYDALNNIKSGTSNGYVWRYRDDVIDDEGNIAQHVELRKNLINKAVVKYDVSGKLIKRYKTQTEAIADGNKRTHIEFISNHKYRNYDDMKKWGELWFKEDELIEKFDEVPIHLDINSIILE